MTRRSTEHRTAQLALWAPATADEHWFGMSCRAVWVAVVVYGVRIWVQARGWQA